VRNYIEQRVIAEAQYIARTGCTVRTAAKVFATSKSTVHKDMTQRLPGLSMSLFESVEKILADNKAERHIRGGLATKAKALAKKDQRQKS
jgi:putative DeoR family transcriptional regulator (stage III sporulation protein D)